MRSDLSLFEEQLRYISETFAEAFKVDGSRYIGIVGIENETASFQVSVIFEKTRANRAHRDAADCKIYGVMLYRLNFVLRTTICSTKFVSQPQEKFL